MPAHRRQPPRYPRLLTERTLPAEAASAAAARACVRAALPEHVEPEVGDTVELLTCELVTNAILHAATPHRLRLSEPQAGVLRVEVDDATNSVAALAVSRPPPTADCGRGLQLVDALAATWGTKTQSAGKTVWFDIRV